MKAKLYGCYDVISLSTAVTEDFFGYALQGKVFICQDISDKVKRFAVSHQVYHLNDRSQRLGWIGSEARANISCGLSDPIGLLFTIKASLNIRRLSRYWK